MTYAFAKKTFFMSPSDATLQRMKSELAEAKFNKGRPKGMRKLPT